MNHIPVTAAQKIALQNRTMLLARILERHIEGTNTIEAVVRAFNLLIDVEPDLDVARVYAHDRDTFTNLTEADLVGAPQGAEEIRRQRDRAESLLQDALRKRRDHLVKQNARLRATIRKNEAELIELDEIERRGESA